MAGIKWSRNQPAPMRFIARQAPRAVPAPTRPIARQPQHGLVISRAIPYSRPVIAARGIPRRYAAQFSQQNFHQTETGTVEARTVFVWPRINERCGVTEYVKHLLAVSFDAKFCALSTDVRRAEHVIIEVVPGLHEPNLLEAVRRLRKLGIRVTLDVHHFSIGNAFAFLFSELNEVIWHHPRSPGLAGAGRYVPLPVPTLPLAPVSRIGGLCHFGIAAQNKRLDVMGRVARELGTKLYVYGHRNASIVPGSIWDLVVLDDSYPDDSRLASLLRQHDVGMIGRSRWATTPELHGSASARFFIGARVPAVVDEAEGHEDLVGTLDVVNFSDFTSVLARTRRLIEDADYRAEALARLERYAADNSPALIAERMGIAVAPKRSFTFGGRVYEYVDHPHNKTRENERRVELAIVWEELKTARGRVLEVGNTLAYYFPTAHDVLDKYEHGPRISNVDVVDFPGSGYELIISVSTLEHVGHDEVWPNFMGRPELCELAIERLRRALVPGGRLIFTVPMGWNPHMDQLVRECRGLHRVRFMRRINAQNDWVEVEDVSGARYAQPFPHGNVVAICEASCL